MQSTRALSVMLFGALLSGVASAQVDPSEYSEAGEVSRVLEPSEAIARAATIVSFMNQASETVRRSLEQARANRDVVKVLCLNDKQQQVDIASRSAEERVASHQTALQSGESAKARHDFAVLEVLNERVEALLAEAAQCVGEEVGFFGDAVLAVTVDPQIPEADPERLGTDIGAVFDGPVLSSPVR
jgi:hypothetical protein